MITIIRLRKPMVQMIHDRQIDTYGGIKGIRDEGLLSQLKTGSAIPGSDIWLHTETSHPITPVPVCHSEVAVRCGRQALSYRADRHFCGSPRRYR